MYFIAAFSSLINYIASNNELDTSQSLLNKTSLFSICSMALISGWI